MEVSQYTNPPLSTIDIPKYELGALTAKTLIDLVEEKIYSPIKISLPFEFIKRESLAEKIIYQKN